jgi:hypothetical protein
VITNTDYLVSLFINIVLGYSLFGSVAKKRKFGDGDVVRKVFFDWSVVSRSIDRLQDVNSF